MYLQARKQMCHKEDIIIIGLHKKSEDQDHFVHREAKERTCVTMISFLVPGPEYIKTAVTVPFLGLNRLCQLKHIGLLIFFFMDGDGIQLLVFKCFLVSSVVDLRFVVI